MSKYVIDKQWRISQEEDQLVILGGQDAIFTIDLESAKPNFFAKVTNPFSVEDLSSTDRNILEQLVSGRIVHPALEVSDAINPNIKVVGNENITNVFVGDDDFFNHDDTRETDLLIFIRSNETFKEFLELVRYENVSEKHLFVDLAYNHVVSLGPLVFPRQTSCIACLQGRIASRWGDEKPPTQPASTTELLDFTREWVRNEIMQLFRQDDFALTNKTIVFDSQNRSMTHNKLLTIPMCPYCKKNEHTTEGKIDLALAKDSHA